MLLALLLPIVFGCQSDSEESLLAQIASDSFEVTQSCLQYAVDKNWFEAATLLVNLSVEREIQIDPSLKAAAQSLKRKVEKFTSSLDNSANVQVASPAYQWAQSPSMIFLDIKFSHRLDTPGCLDVKNPSVEITETRLTFSGNCARSTQRIKFDLDLEFFAEVIPEESTHSFSSVGRLNVNLKKKETGAWPKPMKGKKPSNVHIWWHMKEKHQVAMQSYENDDEDKAEKDL